MSDQSDTLLSLLKPYGLTTEEADIYLFLLKNGFVSALEVSKTLRIGRTRVYRLLDKLVKRQLVVEKLGERGFQFGAASPQRLHQLSIEKELEARALKKALPSLVKELESLMPSAFGKKSKVLFYEGMEGLKQVSYNITRADGLLRVFEVEHMSDFLDFEFSESVRKELVENKIMTYDLTNKKSSPAHTDQTELVKHYSQLRYIDPKKLRIQFEVLIYNDVYATYTYKGDEVFCVEIYNEELATMQKQIFDFIWAQAQPLKYINDRGAATI